MCNMEDVSKWPWDTDNQWFHLGFCSKLVTTLTHPIGESFFIAKHSLKTDFMTYNPLFLIDGKGVQKYVQKRQTRNWYLKLHRHSASRRFLIWTLKEFTLFNAFYCLTKWFSTFNVCSMTKQLVQQKRNNGTNVSAAFTSFSSCAVSD